MHNTNKLKKICLVFLTCTMTNTRVKTFRLCIVLSTINLTSTQCKSPQLWILYLNPFF